MTDAEVDAMRRENRYLKTRNAQLQDDLTDLSAEAGRLREALEHTQLRRAPPRSPNPLGGGQ